MTLRKDEILEFKRKRTISHSLENSLWKEAMDLLQDRLCNEWIHTVSCNTHFSECAWNKDPRLRVSHLILFKFADHNQFAFVYPTADTYFSHYPHISLICCSMVMPPLKLMKKSERKCSAAMCWFSQTQATLSHAVFLYLNLLYLYMEFLLMDF